MTAAFNSLDLKETYDSDEDDILDDFYIPVLSNAVKYDRLAGYFSSASLAASAKGMAQFLQNGGRMRLVTSVHISNDDRKAILEGLTKPDEVISKIMKKHLDGADQMQQDHISALAWMIAKKSLEIKIAIPLTHDGSFYTGDLNPNSIYHQKIGILSDNYNNIVSFSGSVNETARAWYDNIEEFKVFCSWKPGQDVYGSKDALKFEKFWYGNSKSTKVIDLPHAIREHLIKGAPKTEIEAVNKIVGVPPLPPLRDYQQDAVRKWLNNNMRGIFAMATGTGKTRTAISCIKEVCDGSEQNLIVIACPLNHLVIQWKNELEKHGLDALDAYDSSSRWRMNIGNHTEHLNNGIIKNMIIVTTHATFSMKVFTDIIRSSRIRSFLIVDEVHKLGTERSAKGLLDTYNMRLGLSATPQRYFDDEGTQEILRYFDGIIYEFSLDDAIKAGYLTRYLLFPHIVYMADDESQKYNKYSKQIAIESSKDHPDYNRIRMISISRSNILKTAKNKIDKFKEILQNNEILDHCLVYCANNQQIKDADSVLRNMSIIFHRFTFREDSKERSRLLKEFDAGTKDVLLAIKCLDEGVDVPSTKTAIILASSRNPIEFIQRRGRILRTHPGKDRAVIHDLIVLPKQLPRDTIYTESEQAIIRKELERLNEFASSSDNQKYSQNLIQTLMNKYNLS